MISLTAAQADALAFIEDRIAKDGVAPSYDDIREHCGLSSKSGVHRLITALEERGRIRRLPYRARAIEIVPDSAVLAIFSASALRAELKRRKSAEQKAA